MSAASFQTATADAAAQTAKAEWSTTIRMDEAVVKAGSKIRLLIDSKNTSARAILVWEESKNPRIIDMQFRTYVRDENGNAPPETKWGRTARTGKDETGREILMTGGYYEHYVQPGESTTDVIELSGLYDLSQPGSYTVHIERSDDKGNVVFKSNIVTFAVTK
jgi:hypothetical protein